MLALGANGRGRAGLLSALRPQDVFATSLYTGTDGIAYPVSTGFRPDLLWRKRRNAATNHFLTDSARTTRTLYTNTADAEQDFGGNAPTLTSTGFTESAGASQTNAAGVNMAGWSFREAPKFFVKVTYTGDGTSGRVIPHALGIKPGMIIVKRRDAVSTSGWWVYHVSVGAGKYLLLNSTNASATGGGAFSAEPTATGFTIGAIDDLNAAGGTYVAYLFAHDPDTTNGIVQCGSLTASGLYVLGWRPQFLLIKRSQAATNWIIVDTARGWTGGSSDALLVPNTSGAETAGSLGITPADTGLNVTGTPADPIVFLAIRAPIT